ncbi:hypothetical protein D1872_286650 [compost metagenome]
MIQQLIFRFSRNTQYTIHFDKQFLCSFQIGARDIRKLKKSIHFTHPLKNRCYGIWRIEIILHLGVKHRSDTIELFIPFRSYMCLIAAISTCSSFLQTITQIIDRIGNALYTSLRLIHRVIREVQRIAIMCR